MVRKNRYDTGITLLFFLSLGCSLLFSCQRNDAFFSETKREFIFQNAGNRLSIAKNEWNLLLRDEEGKKRFEEYKPPSFLIDGQWESLKMINKILLKDDHSVRMEASLSEGSKVSVEVNAIQAGAFRVSIKSDETIIDAFRGSHKLEPLEEIYGFGEMWNGRLAQRGQEIEIWDKNGTPDECAYMPYYVSTSNYAFFLNYGGLVKFDVGKSQADELTYEASAPSLEFTLIPGYSIASAVENFTRVTGLPACPPRWTFEPWFWLMNDPDKPGASIATLKDVHFLSMTDKLHDLDIPIGVTWLEPPWQDARTSFIPDPDFSKDLKALIEQLAEKGVKTLAWTVPYTMSGASNWEEAVAKNYLVQQPGRAADGKNIAISKSGELASSKNYIYIDFFNPDAAHWWQKQVEKTTELGLKGFKLDAGQSLEKDAILHGGRFGKDVRNSYALEYNKVFAKALREKWGDDYLMIPRAAWIGSSAYHNFKWPGDLEASFADNGLRSSVYSSLSLALSGVPFVSTDIGGFQNRPCEEPVMIRWAQFGAFLPGMQTLHMPWWFSDRTIEHYRYLAWLHTDLIPLWRSLAMEAGSKGTPLIRPLVWDYQDDSNTWSVDDEFTLGNMLLVAPILDSTASRVVYLPEGTWYDFRNEENSIIGPVAFKWSATGADSLYSFPLYVREGAIIPMEVSNRVTGFGSEHSEGYITLAIWPKEVGGSEFILSDREDSVQIKCDRDSDDRIILYLSQTSEDFIFRLHLKDASEIKSIESEAGHALPQCFSSLSDFQADSRDGYYFDRSSGNLWIRKNHPAGNDPMTILIG